MSRIRIFYVIHNESEIKKSLFTVVVIVANILSLSTSSTTAYKSLPKTSMVRSVLDK